MLKGFQRGFDRQPDPFVRDEMYLQSQSQWMQPNIYQPQSSYDVVNPYAGFATSNAINRSIGPGYGGRAIGY